MDLQLRVFCVAFCMSFPGPDRHWGFLERASAALCGQRCDSCHLLGDAGCHYVSSC